MKILVTVPMDDKERAIIEAAAPNAEFAYAAANEVTADMMADKEIIFGNVNAALLQYAKELKLMQLFTAGTDGYIGKLPEGCAIGALIRGNDENALVLMGDKDTVIEAEDHVIVFVPSKKLIPKIERLFTVNVGFF